MLCLAHTTFTELSPSASFNIPMICSSLNLLLFIRSAFPFAAELQFCHVHFSGVRPLSHHQPSEFFLMLSTMIAAIFNHKWKIFIAAAVLIALRCFWLWQPERQVMLHQQHFLEAAQERDWAKFAAFFDDGFRIPTG